MSQDWTDDVYDKDAFTAHLIMSNIELMFATLKSTFSGTSAPSNMVAGLLWLDTTNHLLKIRNEANNAWLTVFDLANFGAFLDVISEKTTDAGVTVEGVVCKDNDIEVGTGGQVKTGIIVEKVGAAGVTIDGLLLKDGALATANSVPTTALQTGILLSKLVNYSAGNYFEEESGEEGGAFDSATYVKCREYKATRSGTVTTRVGAARNPSNGGSGNVYVQVYVNGSPVGTERLRSQNGWGYFPNENIAVSAGDLIQLYGKNGTDPGQGYLAIMVDNPTFTARHYQY